MPEQPNPKRRPHPFKKTQPLLFGPSNQKSDAPTSCDRSPDQTYAELTCVSNYSFLRGASHPDELVEAAATLGYQAMAITDADSLAGVVRAHVAAKDHNVPLIIGAEINTEDGGCLVLLVQDRPAYGRLSRLITLGRRRGGKGKSILKQEDVAHYASGLIPLLIIPEHLLGPRVTKEELDAYLPTLKRWNCIFGDRLWLAVSLHDGPDDVSRLARYTWFEKATGIPLVATGAINAHTEKRRALRDTLTAIHHGCQVKDLGHKVPALGCCFMRPIEDIKRLFWSRPDLLENSLQIANQCQFSLDELRYEYPDEATGRNLRALTYDGAKKRWPSGLSQKIEALIEHELALIEEMNYEGFFLTVYDLVRFARSRGILCQGRGSAANSAVCYALGVTAVDPDRFDLLFERFISKDRNEPPDIDVDFEHERREEVIQYVYERYGRSRAALAATVITYRGRSAVRDVGKALGLSLDQTERLAKNLHYWDGAELDPEIITEAGLDPNDPLLRLVMKVVKEIQGFPRHLSQHVGGMVITEGRLDELCPIENAAMDHRTVIQWDKDDLDALGILKVDCLALGMLTAVRKAFDLIHTIRGHRYELATIPAEVPAVYEMATRADTIGVFQIESRAQMAMLPRFKPKCFYDLVIEVAIVRPGPIQGGMVHPYLKRRAGLETVTYPSEDLRLVLDKTLGVPIFQEQVMKLAVVAAGFTPGEADMLRRAMGAWRRPGIIHGFQEKLLAGMAERGYEPEFAEAVFNQIKGFGEYGFPESHAASFALLTYISLWLKRFEPAAFACSLLNSQPMGFYGPAQLLACAQRHGVPIRPIDVLFSSFDSTLEVHDLESPLAGHNHDPNLDPARYGAGGPALRLGLRLVKGLSNIGAERLVRERQEAPFTSVEDCLRRARLNSKDASILAESGAFRSLSQHRREAWWRAGQNFKNMPLFPTSLLEEETPELPAPDQADRVFADYSRTGLSLEAHPMKLLRAQLGPLGVLDSKDLAMTSRRESVTIAGISICRQRPATASGVMFVTLEDEFGHVNAILRVKEQERFRIALLSGSLLLMKGQIEKSEGVIHVLVGYVQNLSHLLQGLQTKSRDFH
ncbi:MAG: error-prone DNA polymerase [Planctomycetota bacterium]|jgi:error-prone DNA polymerase